MSVARALIELKTLEKRIEKAIQNLKPVGLMLGQRPEDGIQDRKQFEQEAKAAYQQIQALIQRRRQIKQAVILSNASTEVLVAAEKMTVAEAIERKGSIALEKQLRTDLWRKYSEKLTALEEHNHKIERQLFQLLQATYAKPESEVSQEDYQKIAQPFKQNNEASLIDPLNLKVMAFQLEAAIDAFESEVDIALTESNARTLIEVPDATL